MHALLIISGDERRESRIRDVICGVKSRIEQRIRDEKPDVLGQLSHTGRDAEDRDETHGAAEVAVEHPRSGLPHPALRLVDHRAEENIADAVKHLRHRD